MWVILQAVQVVQGRHPQRLVTPQTRALRVHVPLQRPRTRHRPSPTPPSWRPRRRAPLQPLMAQFDNTMIVLTERGFHAKTGDPAHMKVGPRGTWNMRRLVETVLSMMTTVFQSKQVGHRVWAYFRARVAWTMAAFNRLAQWGMDVDDHDLVHLSIAECSL